MVGAAHQYVIKARSIILPLCSIAVKIFYGPLLEAIIIVEQAEGFHLCALAGEVIEVDGLGGLSRLLVAKHHSHREGGLARKSGRRDYIL